MNIFYTCDNNYCWLAGISMISLFENNKEEKKINVYLLGDRISNENSQILISISKKYDRFFQLINVPDFEIPKILYQSRWPKSAFIRMFAADLLPADLNKVLYLDADTIIKNSVSDLFQIENHQFAIYGVKDCVSNLYKKKIGIDSKNNYINAGVLLLDLNKLRKIDIKHEMDIFLKNYKNAVNYADQDILNGIFNGNFGILPPKFDVMTLTSVYNYKDILKLRRPYNYYQKHEIEESKKHPVIIHYTSCLLNIRPWFKGSKHPFASDFIKYKDMSPWAKKLRDQPNFSAKEYKIVSKILKFPYKVSYPLIGILHSFIKPLFYIIKSKF